MSDLADLACEREEMDREAALRRHAARAPAAETNWEERSEKWCADATCGQRIPDERRRAIPGVKFCVECKARREQKERHDR